MNREILNDYREKDDKILLAQILDKIEMVEKKNTDHNLLVTLQNLLQVIYYI